MRLDGLLPPSVLSIGIPDFPGGPPSSIYLVPGREVIAGPTHGSVDHRAPPGGRPAGVRVSECERRPYYSAADLIGGLELVPRVATLGDFGAQPCRRDFPDPSPRGMIGEPTPV